MVDLLGAAYFIAGVFLAYSFYDSTRQRKAIEDRISEPLLKKHFWWHSLLVLFIVVFYEIPIAGFLFNIGASEYALVRRVVFALFVISAYLTIKPLFDLSRTYSFRRDRQLVTELMLFTVLMIFFMLVVSSVALHQVLAGYFIPTLAVLLPASGLLYYHAGKRISRAFNEPSLKQYVSVHSLLVLLVFLLTELEVVVQAGIVRPELVNLVGFVGLVAIAGAVELEKNIALQHIREFSAEYSFGDGWTSARRKRRT